MFSAVAAFDAVFVGSGVNSLTGAALLARGGWSVCVLERNDVLGGAIRTSDDLTAARLHARADGVVAPALRGLGRLCRAGRRPDAPRPRVPQHRRCRPATLFPDGGAAFLTTVARGQRRRVRRATRAGDGAAWQRQFEQFMASAEHSFGVLSAELWSLQGLNLARKAYGELRPPRAARLRRQLARQRARLARGDVRVRARARPARPLGAAHGPRPGAGRRRAS